jgi:hypothetical protein
MFRLRTTVRFCFTALCAAALPRAANPFQALEMAGMGFGTPAAFLGDVKPARQEESQSPISREGMELSGWDGKGKFFVVNARLAVLGDGELFGELEPKLQAGARVFARPLDGMEKGREVPAVYRVEAAEDHGMGQAGCVRLALLKPARSFPELARPQR